MKTMGLCGCEASDDSRKCNSRRIRKVCIFTGPVECLKAKCKDPNTPWKAAKKSPAQTSPSSRALSRHYTAAANYQCQRCGRRYRDKPIWGDCSGCGGSETVIYAS